MKFVLREMELEILTPRIFVLLLHLLCLCLDLKHSHIECLATERKHWLLTKPSRQHFFQPELIST